MSQVTATSKFAQDVIEGLSASQKFLRSKYFYDAKGDEIFQQIMAMPEYYLTRCELEIFEQQKQQILEHMCPYGLPFNLIELGAGDGYKTKVLLKYFKSQDIEFTYYPVDISKHILDELEASLKEEIPGLDVHPLNMDYFEALKHMKQFADRKNVTMFLGSNIGNFRTDDLVRFLSNLQKHFKPNDKLMLGVDLKKNPHTILEAYHDKTGITASFNMNLLTRMNNELGANFDLEAFTHFPLYEPMTGEARSYLVSIKEQTVYFEEMDFEVKFGNGESIHTEISRKYSLDSLDGLAKQCGFTTEHNFLDSKGYFVDTMWEV